MIEKRPARGGLYIDGGIRKGWSTLYMSPGTALASYNFQLTLLTLASAFFKTHHGGGGLTAEEVPELVDFSRFADHDVATDHHEYTLLHLTSSLSTDRRGRNKQRSHTNYCPLDGPDFHR
ncbi:hypothetical protein E1B28_010816 [Marasmius oreades]|uniref:Uncharacterized protein n=1 Tax=Marasmius oreades TaxID=181124 RepID=A0A9P7RTC1_9AGAR|nr:uncharacterized protein E1B28_010816 [Marasmius oreades]KAG7089107.1 hypothetical protein E1B28_010816 [Marasmius oreades]